MRYFNKKDYIYSFPNYVLEIDSLGEPQIYSKKTGKYLAPKRNKNGYKQTTVYNVQNKPLTLNFARFVMMLAEPKEDYTDLVVDHINRNKLDDSISNLRWISPKENANNRNNPRRPHRGIPIIIEFDNGEKIEYCYKHKDIIDIPYVTIYTLAIKKQGTNYSPKYKMKCYYKNEQ